MNDLSTIVWIVLALAPIVGALIAIKAGLVSDPAPIRRAQLARPRDREDTDPDTAYLEADPDNHEYRAGA
ncbi:hypothetical protein [Actinoallomurus iriomotensis]|uniref:Uncharacterized protein n=1 Tax=Actinoallomurus iriomotensis TaxID=478107 RepID=A0A9W6RXW4_9ACTN|nr:hypothetical protein [Actinoallomurus iriomotensis]GLY81880.1 hypothetical protein Airi01_101470 [Actinoallomurus iriomotensis]